MTVVTANTVAISLSLGEWAVTAGQEQVLTCVGLGSRVAVTMFDPQVGLGGMAHMVLPDSTAGRGGPMAAKFVDVAIPLLFNTLKERGAVARRLRVCLAGGSQMLKSAMPAGTPNIGDRNAEAAREQLSTHGLTVNAEHLGGNRGRSVRLFIATGQVTVALPGEPEVEL